MAYFAQILQAHRIAGSPLRFGMVNVMWHIHRTDSTYISKLMSLVFNGIREGRKIDTRKPEMERTS